MPPMSVMQIREKDHKVHHLLSTEGGIKGWGGKKRKMEIVRKTAFLFSKEAKPLYKP